MLGNKHKLTAILSFAIFASLFLSGHAYADPLQDLIESPEMQKFDRESRVIAAQRETSVAWFKPDSNLEKIFETSNGAKNVVSWVDTSVTTWRKSKVLVRRRSEYISAQVHYHNAIIDSDVDVSILIPHPRFQEIVRLRLLKDFTDLEPPSFKPISQETVNIQGNPARAYLKPEKVCSVVIKITRDSLVSVQSSDCSNFSQVIAFAKSLNISRLNRKLDS